MVLDSSRRGTGPIASRSPSNVDSRNVAVATSGGASANVRLRHGWALAAIVALALVLRLVVISASPSFQPHTDAADYDREAVALAVTGRFPASVLTPRGGPSAFRPPLFPIALAAAYKLSGTASATHRWNAGRALEALLGTLTVLLIAAIALQLWGWGPALAAGLLAAIYPPLMLVGSSLMSESLYIPLVLAAVLCALRARASVAPWRWAAAAGLVVGLAAMTRSNGIAMLLPVWLLLWARRPSRSWGSLREPVIVLAATVVTLAPWTVRNAHLLGEFVPLGTESGYAVAGTYNRSAQSRTDYPAMWVPPVTELQRDLRRDPALNEAQLSDRLDTAGIKYLTSHPTALGKTVAWNGLRLLNLTGTGVERWLARYEAYPLWLTKTSVYAFWVLLALAVAGVLSRTAARAPWALWTFPVVIALSSLPFIGATRYRSPADPFLIMLTGTALAAALTWLGDVRRRRDRRPSLASGAGW